MIVFLLIGIFAVLGILLAVVAYSSNQRKRAGQSELPTADASRAVQRRSE